MNRPSCKVWAPKNRKSGDGTSEDSRSARYLVIGGDGRNRRACPLWPVASRCRLLYQACGFRFLPVIAVATFTTGATFILLWIVFSAKSLDTSSSTRPTSTAETYSKQRATVGIVAAPAAVVVAVISAGRESAISFALFVGLYDYRACDAYRYDRHNLATRCARLARYAARRQRSEVLVTAAVAENRSSAINPAWL